jgi:hypothetical protein
MSRHQRINTALSLVLLVSLSTLSFSQENGFCDIKEVFRKEGWNVPGLKGASVLGSKRPYPTMPGVSITTLKPTQTQTTFTYYDCSSEQRGRLQITEYPIGILWLGRVDYRGKTFAYLIHFGRQKYVKRKREDAGAESTFVFYDLDGSGRFTLRRYSAIPQPEFIPHWTQDSLSMR